MKKAFRTTEVVVRREHKVTFSREDLKAILLEVMEKNGPRPKGDVFLWGLREDTDNDGEVTLVIREVS
jgi:hypothetical protein